MERHYTPVQNFIAQNVCFNVHRNFLLSEFELMNSEHKYVSCFNCKESYTWNPSLRFIVFGLFKLLAYTKRGFYVLRKLKCAYIDAFKIYFKMCDR